VVRPFGLFAILRHGQLNYQPPQWATELDRHIYSAEYDSMAVFSNRSSMSWRQRPGRCTQKRPCETWKELDVFLQVGIAHRQASSWRKSQQRVPRVEPWPGCTQPCFNDGETVRRNEADLCRRRVSLWLRRRGWLMSWTGCCTTAEKKRECHDLVARVPSELGDRKRQRTLCEDAHAAASWSAGSTHAKIGDRKRRRWRVRAG